MDWMLPLHRLGQELGEGGVLVLAHPVVDALRAEHVAAACALLGVHCNVGADWAVEHVACEIREALFVVAVLAHFVDFLNII